MDLFFIEGQSYLPRQDSARYNERVPKRWILVPLEPPLERIVDGNLATKSPEWLEVFRHVTGITWERYQRWVSVEEEDEKCPET